MGQLVFPPLSHVYLDTSPIIYTVERHTEYWDLLNSFWLSVKQNEITAFSSELALLETLVMPVRQNNQILIEAYETLLTNTDLILSPITADILRQAAALRAQLNLKTPDAIHAATAMASRCDYLITNDSGLRRLPNINIVFMSDFL